MDREPLDRDASSAPSHFAITIVATLLPTWFDRHRLADEAVDAEDQRDARDRNGADRGESGGEHDKGGAQHAGGPLSRVGLYGRGVDRRGIDVHAGARAPEVDRISPTTSATRSRLASRSHLR